MSNYVTPTHEAGAPPHQINMHPIYGPGDEYLVWKKMNIYMVKKEKISFGIEYAQDNNILHIFHADTEYTQGCEDKDKLPAIDSSWLNVEI